MNSTVAPEERGIDVDGVTFHLTLWSDQGDPIVFLHDLDASSRIWDRVARLTARTCRVMTYDQRGHGETDQPDSGYDLATSVNDLHAVLGSLDYDHVTLVGHGWGANVGLQYAAVFPSEVARLVLVDGGFTEFQLQDDATWATVEKGLLPPDLRMPLPKFVEKLRTRLGAVYDGAARDSLLGSIWVDDRGVVRPKLARSHHVELAHALWEHRPSRIYPKVHCPTLVVAAQPPDLIADPERLRRRRREVALAEQRLSRSRVLWLRDTIHEVPLHRPSELAEAILRFILAT